MHACMNVCVFFDINHLKISIPTWNWIISFKEHLEIRASINKIVDTMYIIKIKQNIKNKTSLERRNALQVKSWKKIMS